MAVMILVVIVAVCGRLFLFERHERDGNKSNSRKMARALGAFLRISRRRRSSRAGDETFCVEATESFFGQYEFA